MSRTLSDSVFVGNPLRAYNGAVVDAWLASRTWPGGLPPAEGAAPPLGSPDAGPVTTSPAFGNEGAFDITVPDADVYLRAVIGSVVGWKLYPREGTWPPPGIFPVTDYGADPTGTNDSLAAFNAATAAASAYSAGNPPVILITPGAYLLSAPWVIDMGAVASLELAVLGWQSSPAATPSNDSQGGVFLQGQVAAVDTTSGSSANTLWLSGIFFNGASPAITATDTDVRVIGCYLNPTTGPGISFAVTRDMNFHLLFVADSIVNPGTGNAVEMTGASGGAQTPSLEARSSQFLAPVTWTGGPAFIDAWDSAFGLISASGGALGGRIEKCALSNVIADAAFASTVRVRDCRVSGALTLSPGSYLVRGNSVANPAGTLSTATPGVPATTVPVANPLNCTVVVAVTAAGGGNCAVVVGALPSVTVPAGTTVDFLLGGGEDITLTYASAPTWAWTSPQPAVLATTVTGTNLTGYDCQVFITGPVGGCSYALGGGSDGPSTTVLTLTSGQSGSLFLLVGQSYTPTYPGAAPTEVWIGE